MKRARLAAVVAGACVLAAGLSGCVDNDDLLARKPVLYLYPQAETRVEVRLALDGELTAAYPAYDGGWTVTACPDGTLYDERGREYDSLFWEGRLNTDWDWSRGFSVRGEDTVPFLEEILEEIGLTSRESAAFISYWLPYMQQNAYNLVTFQTDTYTDAARLEISPAPDSLLRVFMVFKAMDGPADIEPQSFPRFDRQGFTAVEWGGAERI